MCKCENKCESCIENNINYNSNIIIKKLYIYFSNYSYELKKLCKVMDIEIVPKYHNEYVNNIGVAIINIDYDINIIYDTNINKIINKYKLIFNYFKPIRFKIEVENNIKNKSIFNNLIQCFDTRIKLLNKYEIPNWILNNYSNIPFDGYNFLIIRSIHSDNHDFHKDIVSKYLKNENEILETISTFCIFDNNKELDNLIKYV